MSRLHSSEKKKELYQRLKKASRNLVLPIGYIVKLLNSTSHTHPHPLQKNLNQ
ncbi:hypothetical protein M7I_7541 [Glarea lozoyensis 74030]|uniref:Uncharacterized protein n=1 Tax=Glarea lozoyensis (strain ATCC 74030 / MF5533) TaxID=1104152 RepID=H0EXK5_GLAL7|nr:hypothetical protein M7I_7541 [Glarea lozoyensis 74030]